MPTIDVDDDRWEAFARRAEEKDFGSTEDYLDDVLRQLYEKLQQQSETYSEEEEEQVRERLKNLGYLD